jgi:hypothetical protein
MRGCVEVPQDPLSLKQAEAKVRPVDKKPLELAVFGPHLSQDGEVGKQFRPKSESTSADKSAC